ncbi:MAG: family 65 glycosyl hydrolase domain-containing protein [Bacteroidia bacterium]
MKNYLQLNEWSIIENGFHPEYHQASESIFSIGNGRMGQRANFEEKYSGKMLQGSYVAGIYYPDKTRVGWWKNGYPEYYARMVNAANWIGINVEIDGEELDLNVCEVEDFRRELNMKAGYLERSFVAVFPSGKRLKVHSTRFCSIVDDEAGAVRYAITPLNFSADIRILPYIDFDTRNRSANYGDVFWEEVAKEIWSGEGYVTAATRITDFHLCTGMKVFFTLNGKNLRVNGSLIAREKFVANAYTIAVQENEELTLYKYAANVSSENHEKEDLTSICKDILYKVSNKMFGKMLEEQAAAWAKKWQEMNITIEGDVAAQQGIRFNIFQLHQTYSGEDERLNISPKGFTGEKYGGSTYWDTEAYCLPFYLSTASQNVAKNLLLYRYKHLSKAIENAEKLGFNKGAALYPMVTVNGDECHNEWEITFEEIHRNGAIAYAIYNYVRYTGDTSYYAPYGLEVLIAIARFWVQRVNFSAEKNKFVLLGVTGPNEYENNVNNNWYTNYLAAWCLTYANEVLTWVEKNEPSIFEDILLKTKLNLTLEPEEWLHVAENMYFPENQQLGIFLQQEGYLDKSQILVKDLPQSERPLWQKWSWDKILRSCFVKHADVLQGLFFFEDHFDVETIRKNFHFYEPRTVHESALSPCVHAVLAAKIGDIERAYQFYLQTARVDLDDYNENTEEGCHITSMAGTWLAIVQGFGGLRVKNDRLHFHPQIPQKWKSYAFKLTFREWLLNVSIAHDTFLIENQSDTPLFICVSDKEYRIAALSTVNISEVMLA